MENITILLAIGVVLGIVGIALMIYGVVANRFRVMEGSLLIFVITLIIAIEAFIGFLVIIASEGYLDGISGL